MSLEHETSSHRPSRQRLAVVAVAIALVLAACGQTTAPPSGAPLSGALAPSGVPVSPSGVPASPSSVPASPPVTAAPSPAPTDVASVALPDKARIVDTKTFGEVPVNQVIVVLADGRGPADADALATSLGGRVVGQLDFLNAYQVETSGTTEADLTAALATARGTVGVTIAAANQSVSPDEESNEIWGTRISPLSEPPYNGGGNADGYGLIGVSTAWDYIRGSGMDTDLVQVGVVDSGVWTGSNEFDEGAHVTTTEPDANLSDPEKKANADGSTSDDPSGGHGSGVNIIIGADADDGGPVGIASVLGDDLTISNTNIFGSEFGTTWTAAAPDPDDPSIVQYPGGSSYQFSDLVAIMRQVQAGSTVINLSFGPTDYTKTDPNVPKIYRAFFGRMLKEHPGVLFVASAGNDGTTPDGSQRYPGGVNSPNVMTIGNVTNDGKVWKSSNRPGGDDFEVSIYAPGHQAVRGYNKDTGEVKNIYGGTSMAAPQVVATAALLRSLNKNLSAEQIKKIITSSATDKDGVPILSVDEAVLAVINLNCDDLGIPRMDKETLLGRGAVDAVAVPVAGKPGAFTIRGIVKATGDKGVDLDITVAGYSEVTSGDEPTHLEAAGEATWTVTLDPPDEGVIVVRRTDTKAGSRIVIETIDVNGAWAGSFTFVSSELSPEVKAQAEAMAEEQGCDLAILEALQGKALPMTLDLTVEPNSTGTATYKIDVSSIKDSKGEPMTSETQTGPVTYGGNRLTFQLEGKGGAMSGVVTRSGETLTINGTLTITGEGYSAKGVWTVTKPRD